ncbi:MAG: hypothetical protein LBM01_03210 [Christensenellaceae bacterium]|jgi:hypothetical protein|nr:hypothetical protein [Christensenellaceae bacterium]
MDLIKDLMSIKWVKYIIFIVIFLSPAICIFSGIIAFADWDLINWLDKKKFAVLFIGFATICFVIFAFWICYAFRIQIKHYKLYKTLNREHKKLLYEIYRQELHKALVPIDSLYQGLQKNGFIYLGGSQINEFVDGAVQTCSYATLQNWVIVYIEKDLKKNK